MGGGGGWEGRGRRLGLRGGDANAGRRAALARAVRHEQSEDFPFIFIEKRGETLCSTELRIQSIHFILRIHFTTVTPSAELVHWCYAVSWGRQQVS